MSGETKKYKELILDTEGQVTLTETDNGLKIELFQQNSLSDEIDKSQVHQLIKWLVNTNL